MVLSRYLSREILYTLIALLIVPFTSPELMREVLGAGGIGPAGGGGGGTGRCGRGAVRWRDVCGWVRA